MFRPTFKSARESRGSFNNATSILSEAILQAVEGKLSAKLDRLCNKFTNIYQLTKCSWFIGMKDGELNSHYDDAFVNSFLGISFRVQMADSDIYMDEDDAVLADLMLEAKPLVTEAINTINAFGAEQDEISEVTVKASLSNNQSIGDLDLLGYSWWGAIDGYVINCSFEIHYLQNGLTDDAFEAIKSNSSRITTIDTKSNDSFNYFVLVKTSENKEDPFFEYRVDSMEKAQDAFFSTYSPSAIVAKGKEGVYNIIAMTNLTQDDRELLDEQIELLNTSSLRDKED